MNEVILTPTNSLVRKKTSKYELELPEIDINGMLVGFIIKTNGIATRYIFIDASKYLKVDQTPANANTIVTGFVKYDSYTNYINAYDQNLYNYNYIIDPIHWFDLNFEWAQIGDLFTISKLETSPDFDKTDNYTKYFVDFKCEFIITDFTIDFTNSDEYPPLQPNVTLPGYCKIDKLDHSSPLFNSFDGRFFRKNLGSKIATLQMDDEFKKILYIGMVKICWRITNIFNDVLSKLAIKDLVEIESISKFTQPPVNTDIRTYINNGGIPGLSDIDKAIVVLLIDWGYRSYDDTLEIFSIDITDQMYGGYYVPFENYYNTLVNLYINIVYTKEEDLFGISTDPLTWSPSLIQEQSNLRLEKLISIIPDGAYNFLSLDSKIKILKTFAENSIYESREDAVVKIVKSIQQNESTNFLYRLQSETYLIDGKEVTLFERLYDKINDRIIFFGKNNRRSFINNLYYLWYRSQLNPYNSLAIGLAGEDANTSQSYFDTFYKNQPIVLNYNSKKVFRFFVDNMNFEFNGKNISVEEEVVIGYSATVGGGEVIEQKGYVHKGNYDFYASMSLQHFDENDIAVKIPAIALQPNGNEESYIFPIFYVKYIDDYGDNQDLITASEVALEVALTFTGIGNITKLSYLRHLSLLGRIAFGGGASLTGAETILLMSALSGAGAFVKLTSGVAKSILDYYSNGCEIYINKVKANINDSTPGGQIPSNPNNQIPKYEWCKKLDNFLYWAQAVSTGGESIAEDMLRESAKDLATYGLPADFPPNAKTFILTISDLEGELTNFLASISTFTVVKGIVSNFANQKDKYAFMFDFRNKNVSLGNLNTEPDLIDIWLNMSPSLKKFRNNIDVLRARKFIDTNVNDKFVEHIFEGEVKIFTTNIKTGGYHHIYGPGVMSNTFGVITSVLSTDRGYSRTFVKIKHIPSSVLYVKGSYNSMVLQYPYDNDMFRQDWSRNEVLDNLALAYATKSYWEGNKYKGIMSDNQEVIICIRGGNGGANTDYQNALVTCWPKII